MDTRLQIPRKHKILFWFILGAYSTFFAEVFAGSDMFPFFHTWGILVVWPLYGLHAIILTTLIFRYGKPRLSTLVFGGMLFGLYEAYMTKVVWEPTWGAGVKIGGVAVVEVFVIVFWWHTWFSFITPLIFGETLLTTSREVVGGLPDKLRLIFTRWEGWLGIALFGAIFQSINSPSLGRSLLSGLSTVGFLIFLTWLWRRTTREQAYALPVLLPNRREFLFLAIWLGVLYLFLGFGIYPERIPGLTGQAAIWGLYALVIVFFMRGLQVSRRIESPSTSDAPIASLNNKTWLLVGMIFITTLPVAKAFLSSFSGVIALGGWLAGGLFGIVMFFIAVRETIRRI